MNYSQALRILRSRGNEVQGIHLGLHRIRTVMKALGDPHLLLPAVVHIAGTNGKGSVASMTDAILRHAGQKVGFYSSPHLVSVLERIRVDGRPVGPLRFASLLSRIHRLETRLLRRDLLDIPLTYFELLTACMFLHFSEQRVDVAVIEVGLGGTLDATNVVWPAVSVITSISRDHQDILGNSLARIAGEKAGIVKPGVPVVSGVRGAEARRVISRKARAAGAPLTEVGRSSRIRTLRVLRGHCVMDLETPRHSYRKLRLALAGEHQARNAALAVMAVEALHPARIPARSIRAGLSDARWPGRLDLYRCARRTLLDGAHNPEGAGALHKHLRKHVRGEIVLVFGALRDKEIRAIGKRIFPPARSIHLAPIGSARTADPRAIAAMLPEFRARFRLHENAAEALRAAWRECAPTGCVVVTGSLYLLGELLPLIRRSSAGSPTPG